MNKYTKLISLFSSCLLLANAQQAPLSNLPLEDKSFQVVPARSMPSILWFWHQTEMTPEVIETQMNEMHAAGFRGIMMFPLHSTPKFYTEEFYVFFEHVLRHAEKLKMSIWLTNDQAIPTGHGATKVVPGAKINENLTLEPRPDLRAQKLLHVNVPVTGGRTVNLTDSFPGYHDLPSTITYYQGMMNGRATEMIVGNEGGNWIDYKYEIDVTPLPWSGNLLVPGNYTDTSWVFRADKASNSGYAWSLSDRTKLGNGVPALRKIILKDGKAIKELPPVKLSFEKFEEKPYKIKTVAHENRIETFINGISVDVTVDNTYTKGTVGFYLPHPCRGKFDNIKVLSMGDDLIFEDNCDNNTKWRFWGPSASVDEVFSVAAIPMIDGKLQANGILDLTKIFQAKPAHWIAPAGEWQLDFHMKRKDTKMPFNYPDLYHPDTIKRHLQITYGEILRRYPWAMGKTFKGFWSDEPHTTASKGKAWSAQFEKNLLAGGHEIGTTLAAVYNDLGREGRRLKAPYYQQAIECWTEPFARLQGEWCAKHGLDFMTNPVIDSAAPYGALSGGNGLQMNQYSNVPGVDAIYGQIMPGKRSLISRWATSSAHQLGNQHVLYEVYGGYGWDVTPDIVRYVNGSLMVRGCNRASYHAYWSNPDAVGYAPPFDPSNTWWSVQNELNLWNGRLQEMSLGKTLSNVGLMNPTSTLYADEMNLDGRLMNPAFTELYYLLEDHQVVFDLVDETSLNGNPIMKTQAVPVHGGLQVGRQRYNLIIVPRAHTLSLEALQKLDAMVELGGVVIATHLMPEEELKGRDKELTALLKKVFGENPSATPHSNGRGWTAFVKAKEEIPALLDKVPGSFGQSLMRAVRFEKEYPQIRVIKRERANAIVYLIMNEGSEAVTPQTTFYDTGVPEIWNPETGSQVTAPVFSSYGDWGVTLPLALEPHQTKVVVFKKERENPADVPHLLSAPKSADVLSVKADSDQGFVATLLTDSTGEFELEGSYKRLRYTAKLNTPKLPSLINLDSEWKLSFLDKVTETQQVKLASWTDLRPDYSGTAKYQTSFNLPASELNANRQWHIDLGKVADVARIEINGQKLEPMLWHPYTQNLTPHLKAGENKLTVYVSNTLANKHGEVKESGLLGPVSIKPKQLHTIEFKKPLPNSGHQPVIMPKTDENNGQPITTEFIYREVGDADLKMKVWYPPNWKPGGKKLPASVFLFGGGWYTGAITQFNGVAPYLANRGMIVLTPEYRTHRDGVEPNICLEDSKSAMRYIYKNADKLGIDISKVAAGGRSAGGHLAAAAAFSKGFNAVGDDLNISCKPKALILFNPVIDNGPGGFRHEHVKDYWEDFSPLHTITKNPPPTIFLTGDKDQYTPIETAHKYKKAQEAQGGRCELIIFEGGVHGSPFAAQFQERSYKEMDAFLVSIGYLTSK